MTISSRYLISFPLYYELKSIYLSHGLMVSRPHHIGISFAKWCDLFNKGHPRLAQSGYKQKKMQFEDNLSGRTLNSNPSNQNNSLQLTPARPIPTHRYSEHHQPKKSHRDADVQRLKLTTILQSMNPQGMFPKISKPKPNSPGEEQNKLKLLKLRAYFKKEHEQTETTQERSMTIDTHQQSDSAFGQLLDHSKLLSQDRSQCYSHNSQLASAAIKRREPQPAAFQLQEEDESDDDEFEKEAVPGPGSYSYSYSDFDRKGLSKRSTDVSFLSKMTRFRYPKVEEKSLPPPIVQTNQFNSHNIKERERSLAAKKRSQKVVPFNSKSPRQSEIQLKVKEKSPGPQDYSPRQGIEQELIRKIQRHFKSNFGSNSQRFPPFGESTSHLGPGCYPTPQPYVDELQGESHYFRSQLPRLV